MKVKTSEHFQTPKRGSESIVYVNECTSTKIDYLRRHFSNPRIQDNSSNSLPLQLIQLIVRVVMKKNDLLLS